MSEVNKVQKKMSGYTKLSYIVLLLLLSMIGFLLFQSVSSMADGAEQSFYYLIESEAASEEYYVMNANAGIQDEHFVLAKDGNIVFDWIDVPDGQALCSWQVVLVEPDVYELPIPSGYHVHDASASDAIPSEMGVTVTEHHIFLQPGGSYPIDELEQYANGNGQIVFRPVFHNQYVHLESIEATSERAKNITYWAVFDQAVQCAGVINGETVVQTEALSREALFTVEKPVHGPGTLDEFYLNAHYTCEQCHQAIALQTPYLIHLPFYDEQSGNGSGSDGNGAGTGGAASGPGGNNSGRESSSESDDAETGVLQVEISSPDQNGWYTQLPELTMEVRTGYQVYYQLWNTSLGQEQEQAAVIAYDKQLALEQDGIYQCSIWAQRKGSQTRNDEQTLEFQVDLAEPQISVSYYSADNPELEEGKYYYPAARQAVITIDEVNFSEADVVITQSNGNPTGVWEHEGSIHTTTVLFETDGICSINVSSTDLAGRQGQLGAEHAFVIDRVSPLLNTEGVTDLSATKEAVTPVISFSDEYLDHSRTKITLERSGKNQVVNGGYSSQDESSAVYAFEPIDEDGNYLLTAQIYDLAGNITEEIVRFSINRKGATFVFTQNDIVDSYTNKPFYPDIEIWNADELSIVSLKLNGREVEYDRTDKAITFREPINKDGKYVINLTVKDAADNITVMEPVEFVFDQTPPEIVVQGVETNAVYREPLTVKLYTEQREDDFEAVYLNGVRTEDYEVDQDGIITLRVITPGTYTLGATSTDRAGNVSKMIPVAFTYRIDVDAQRSAGIGGGYFIMWKEMLLALFVIVIVSFIKGRFEEKE